MLEDFEEFDFAQESRARQQYTDFPQEQLELVESKSLPEYQSQQLVFGSTWDDIERTTAGPLGTQTADQDFIWPTTKEDKIRKIFLNALDNEYFRNLAVHDQELRGFKNHLLNQVSTLEGVEHKNPVCLALASFLLWLERGFPTEKQIAGFLKRIKLPTGKKAEPKEKSPIFRPVDFVRYLRFLDIYGKSFRPQIFTEEPLPEEIYQEPTSKEEREKLVEEVRKPKGRSKLAR